MHIRPERFAMMKSWCLQRQMIKDRRDAGLPKSEWYTDIEPAVKDWHYCNVRRMDDRVSKWLNDNWFQSNIWQNDMKPTERLLWCGVARQINRIGTLAKFKLEPTFDWQAAQNMMQRMMDEGETVFTSAYMLTGSLTKKDADGHSMRTTKVVQITELILKPLQDKLNAGSIDIGNSMQGLHEQLEKGHPGFSSFLAGQVVADARWANVFGNDITDTLSWAPRGPGSYKGLNMLYKPDEEPWFSKNLFMEYFHDYQQQFWADPELRALFDRLRLEAHDMQNVLCETSKYIGIKVDGKRAKRRYLP